MSGLSASRWATASTKAASQPVKNEPETSDKLTEALNGDTDGTADGGKVENIPPVEANDVEKVSEPAEVVVDAKVEAESEANSKPEIEAEQTASVRATDGVNGEAAKDEVVEQEKTRDQLVGKPLPTIVDSEEGLPKADRNKELPSPPKDEEDEVIDAEPLSSAVSSNEDEEATIRADTHSGDATTPQVVSHVSPTKTTPEIEASRLEVPRLRKRVSWRGKNCIISIPRVDFTALGLPTPMSAAEVAERVKGFEDAGYNVRGFDLGTSSFEEEGLAHNRAIFPDETETRQAASQARPLVTLPDLRKWADYMDWLTEQKLAALGVSLGFEETQPAQIASQDMSRQSSAQYPPLPFSPPIPAASANSIGRPGLIRGHSHTMSVASPISPANVPQFGHAHRASVVGTPFMFPQQQQLSQFSQQPLIHGLQAFSPPPQMGVAGLARGGSPAQLNAFRDTLGSVPSPLHQQILSQSPSDYSRSLLEDQLRRQQGFISQHQQQPSQSFTFPAPMGSLHQTPTLPELPEEDDEEVEEAPKHEPEPEPVLRDEPSTPTESEAQAYVPPHKRAHINGDIAVPTPRGHRHNISEGLERDILEAEKRNDVQKRDWADVSDVHEEDERSSISRNSKKSTKSTKSMFEKDPLGSNLPVQITAHARKKSTIRFNAAAPVFQFNPTATFTPQSSNFTFEAAGPKLQGNPTNGHSRSTSSGSLNVAAPVFRPQGIPKTDFSFSAQGPVFPSDDTTNSPLPAHKKSIDGMPSIFGKVDIPDIVKPSRSSKAITIVRPEDALAKGAASGTDQEDSEGRLAQSGDRLKRQRFFGDDGDEVPKFASPTPEPDSVVGANLDHKESVPPSMVLRSQKTQVDEAGTNGSRPLEFISNNVAGSAQTVAHGQKKSLSEAVAQGIKHGHKGSGSLSALAKPFQPAFFQPAEQPTEKVVKTEPEPAPAPVEKPVSNPVEKDESISELEEGEIREDEVPTSPLQAPQPQTSAKANQAPADPSFAELDNIMQQLNDMEVKAKERESNDLNGTEGEISPLPTTPGSNVMTEPAVYIPPWRRNKAVSPSPVLRQQLPQQAGHVDSSFTIHERTDSGERVNGGWSQITRLNRAEDVPTSDWSGILSPPDEEKLHQRSRFFDSHIDDVIGRVVDRRLQPFQDSLRSIENTFSKRARSIDQHALKRSSSTLPESDADDEDDHLDDLRQRPISRGRDKRVDQIKAVVLEALREQSPRHVAPAENQAAHDIAELHSILADMKVSFARAASSSLDLEDIRSVVESAVKQHSTASEPALQPASITQIEIEHKRVVSELEGRLNQTLAGALEEANRRRAVEEREAEGRRLLRLAEEEVRVAHEKLAAAAKEAEGKQEAEQRESEVRHLLNLAEEELELLRDTNKDSENRAQALEDERSQLKETSKHLESRLQTIEDEREQLLERIEHHESEAQLLRDTSKENINKIVAMDVEQQTLIDRAERAEAAKMESVTRIEALEAETAALEQTLEEYRASSNKWRQDIDEAKRENEELEKTISGLEDQLEDGQASTDLMKRRLEKLHNDMATAAGQLATEKAEWRKKEDTYRKRFEAFDTQRTSEAKQRVLLEEELRTLRATAAEVVETKANAEQLRTSNVSLEGVIQKLQIELAEQQSAAARFEREYLDAKEGSRSEMHRVQMAAETEIEAANHQVKIVRAELETELSRMRSELENAKIEAETAKARHQRVIEEDDNARRDAVRKANHANSVALEETRQRHDAALQELNAQHTRALNHAIEDKQRSEAFLSERLALSDDKLRHYQERAQHLEERLEIAKSAAQAAALSAQNKAPATFAAASGLPERVSPQALRESILVLQEQLQDREVQIDRLKAQVEKEGVAKVKERDTEISWLRELLAVRNEELGDLTNELSKPDFDRSVVRDTAIRIRANLDMQLQERERGAPASPSVGGSALATLSSFATPRAAQLSSAFSKWRSAMENPALKHTAPRRPAGTPSRAPVATRRPKGFDVGLMTPPASNLRGTPSPEATASLPPPRLQQHQPRSSSSASSSKPRGLSGTKERQSSTSSNTQLFQEQNYDRDAEDHPVHMPTFDEDEDEEDLNVDDAAPAPGFRSLEAELEDGDGSFDEEQGDEPLTSVEPIQE